MPVGLHYIMHALRPIINYISNSNMQVDIKQAETGHNKKIKVDATHKAQRIMAQIHSSFGIAPKHQLLLTKSGHIIKPHQLIAKVLLCGEVDKTLAGGFKQDGTMSNQKIPCIFLFNLEELNKPQSNQKLSDEAWIEWMKQKMITVSNTKISFDFEPLTNRFSSDTLQGYSKQVQRINSLKDSYSKLTQQYLTLNEYKLKIEALFQQCNIQKRSINPLSYCIKDDLKRINKQIDILRQKRKNHNEKMGLEDKSLRENSSFFQNRRKNQNKMKVIDEKLQKIRVQLKQQHERLKSQIKLWKANFNSYTEAENDFLISKYIKQIQARVQQNKQNYHQIVQFFTLVVKGEKELSQLQELLSRRQNIVKQYFGRQYQQILQFLKDHYIKFGHFKQQGVDKVKIHYHSFVKFQKQNQIFADDLSLIKKDFNQEIAAEKLDQSNKQFNVSQFYQSGIISNSQASKSNIIQPSQQQLKQRIVFQRKISTIQSFCDKICHQQQKRRKQFANNSSLQLEMAFLKNTKVPSMQIDYEGTSDPDVIRQMRMLQHQDNSQMNIQQFMLCQYNDILAAIKKVGSKQTNVKIKNMEEIIVKMSDIFAKVYSKQIQQLIKEKQTFQQKCRQMQNKCIQTEQRYVQTDNFKQYKLKQIEDLNTLLAQKQQLLISRELQRSDEMNKQRLKFDKLKKDYKQVQKKLSSQLQLSQQLLQQMGNMDEDLNKITLENQQLKALLADKQIQMIKMQASLTNNTAKIEAQKNQQDEYFMKNNVVLQDLSKHLQTNQQQQISRLQRQINIIQKQNQQLQEQNQQLNQQMRRIIMKQTEDAQTQTHHNHNQKETLYAQNSIAITQDVIEGQKVLLMPFSNGCYVAVTRKDQDRTVCNMGQMTPINYFLDLNHLPFKTKQLLNQCSFLVVLNVTGVNKQGAISMVQGKIQGLFGFEDDSPTLKNYASLLPVQ